MADTSPFIVKGGWFPSSFGLHAILLRQLHTGAVLCVEGWRCIGQILKNAHK